MADDGIHAHRLYRLVGVACEATARRSSPASGEGRADEVSPDDRDVIMEKLDRNEAKLDRIERALVGTPDGETKGLQERVRIIERALGSVVRIMWLSVTAALTSVVAFLWQKATGTPPPTHP